MTSADPHSLRVACSFCSAKRGDRCRTKSGKVYEESAHRDRQKVWTHDAPPLGKMFIRKPEKVEGAVGIKLALWFIQKTGSVKDARRFFEAAATALEGIDEC